MTTKDELRSLASKATPGPWTVQISGMRGGFSVYIPEAQKHEAAHSDDGLDGYTVSSANRNYIAAASPEAVTKLLDEIERLKEKCKVCGQAGGQHHPACDPLWGNKTD